MKRHAVGRGMAAAALAVGLACCGCGKRGTGAGAGSASSAELARQLGDPTRRAQAARELGRRKVKEAAEMIRVVAADKDPEVRLACLWALGQIGDPSTAAGVRFYVDDTDERVRMQAIESLGSLVHPESVAGLAAAAEAEDGKFRLAAYRSLARLGGDEAVAALVRGFFDSDAAARDVVKEGTLRLGPPAAKRVIAAMRRADGETLPVLIDVLLKLDSPETMAGLMAALAQTRVIGYRQRETAARLRGQVMDALVALGPAAAQRLVGLTQDRSPEIRQAAAVGCVRIGEAVVEPIAELVRNWRTARAAAEVQCLVGILEEIDTPRAQEVIELAGRKLAAAARRPEPAATQASRLPGPDLLAGAPATLSQRPTFYRDVKVVLQGALPNSNPNLGKDLELYLGYLDADASKGAAPAWRKYVLGYSAFYERGTRLKHYNWVDDEGVLTDVKDDGGRLRLVVDMQINDGPWVAGGRGRYTLDLKRDGRSLTGTFEGTFDKRPCSIGGPGGRKQVRGQAAGTIAEKVWPTPAADWKPLQPGEHPRLIFRKSDLPALRKRMEAPEGKAILARLKMILARDGREWTLWHGMGYGMLYQLTGDREYAALARQHVQYARTGERANVDGRYSYVRPGGKLRAGSSYAAIAMAYDLCYEAWDADYRRGLARELDRKLWEGTDASLVQSEPAAPGLVIKTGGGQHSPHSNHYGAWIGGGGTAVLAILGDPGVDAAIMTRSHRIFRRRAKRALEVGYTQRAYFWEGHHCGRLSCNTGLVSYLQALRTAAGEDYLANSEAAQWLLTKWIYEVVPVGKRFWTFPHGLYPFKIFGRGGMSTGGDFAQGFGIVPAAHKPAVLWAFQHVICPGPDSDYDAINYPHRAVYAFVNWPIGLKPRDPGEVLGNFVYDEEMARLVCRSGWRGEDDVALMFMGGATILSRQEQLVGTSFPGPPGGKLVYHHREPDGTTVLTTEFDREESAGRFSLAMDLGRLSGAEILLAAVSDAKRKEPARREGPQLTGKQRKELAELVERVRQPKGEGPIVLEHGKAVRVTAGGRHFSLMALRVYEPPTVIVVGDGERIVVGKRTIAFDGQRIVLGR